MKQFYVYSITIKAGVDYAVDFIYAQDNNEPVDMTGWGVAAELREFDEMYTTDVPKTISGRKDAHVTGAIPFECSADETGIHLKMDQAVTSTIHWRQGFYDVFITNPDGTIRQPLVSGRAYIIPRTSKWSKRSSMIFE